MVNILTNGNFSASAGVGATSVAGPVWQTDYLVPSGGNLFSGAGAGQARWAFFTTNASQVTNGDGASIPALGARSMAVNVGILGQDIIRWPNVMLINGATYRIAMDAAVIYFPFSVAMAIDGVAVLAIPAPPAQGTWFNTAAQFTWQGATGLHNVSLRTNTGAAGGNDHAFDNFELERIPPIFAGVRQSRDCCQALPVCYESSLPCGFAGQTDGIPPALDVPVLVQNTSGFTITSPGAPSAPNLVNGVLGGDVAFRVNCGGGIQNFLDTVHLAVGVQPNPTVLRMLGFGYWNGWGGDHTDGDGLGGMVVDFFDAANVLLLGGFALPNVNNTLYHSANFAGPLANVDHLLIRAGSKPVNGSLHANMREIAAIWEWEGRATWQCQGVSIVAAIRQATPAGPVVLSSQPSGMRATIGGGLTVTGALLTQTNGPHTMTFDAGGLSFSGNIITDNPGNFSSLVISDEFPTITVSGDAVNQFAIDWTELGGGRRLAVLVDGVLTDAATGMPVVNPTIVPCGT